MSVFRFPSVFLSHGTPMLAYGEDQYQAMLEKFSASLPKPKAIVFISAHSVSSEEIHVLKTKQNWIQHDFTGFPKDLYEVQYNCPGDEVLSNQIAEMFLKAGFKSHFDLDAPLDHGIWIPLMHLYPKGDVPVVRLSLPLNLEPAQILKMGHTLAQLREQGIMIIASGGAVHNLQKMQWSKKTGEGRNWAKEFEEFLILVLGNKDVEALLGASEHPLFSQAHPSQEHFLPLLFAVGAALTGDQVNILYRGIEYDSLSMLCFSLNHEPNQPLH
jgi:4,5-DOPA dioxygenase extradiol